MLVPPAKCSIRRLAALLLLATAPAAALLGCANSENGPKDAWHENYRQRENFSWWTPPDPMLDLWTLPYPPPADVGAWSDPFSPERRNYGDDTKPDPRWTP